jgi:hypothetical protein
VLLNLSNATCIGVGLTLRRCDECIKFENARLGIGRRVKHKSDSPRRCEKLWLTQFKESRFQRKRLAHNKVWVELSSMGYSKPTMGTEDDSVIEESFSLSFKPSVKIANDHSAMYYVIHS